MENITVYELMHSQDSSMKMGKQFELCNFGTNNYSDGMSLVSSSNNAKELTELAKKGLLGNIWFTSKGAVVKRVRLNPSAPCSDFEFFGVLGTDEQYEKLYQNQKNAVIGKAMCDKFGYGHWNADPLTTTRYERDLRESYKDWWEK